VAGTRRWHRCRDGASRHSPRGQVRSGAYVVSDGEGFILRLGRRHRARAGHQPRGADLLDQAFRRCLERGLRLRGLRLRRLCLLREPGRARVGWLAFWSQLLTFWRTKLRSEASRGLTRLYGADVRFASRHGADICAIRASDVRARPSGSCSRLRPRDRRNGKGATVHAAGKPGYKLGPEVPRTLDLTLAGAPALAQALTARFYGDLARPRRPRTFRGRSPRRGLNFRLRDVQPHGKRCFHRVPHLLSLHISWCPPHRGTPAPRGRPPRSSGRTPAP